MSTETETTEVEQIRLMLLSNLRDHRGWAISTAAADLSAFAAAVRVEHGAKIAAAIAAELAAANWAKTFRNGMEEAAEIARELSGGTP